MEQEKREHENSDHVVAPSPSRPVVLLSVIARRFQAILDSLAVIKDLHERVRPGGALSTVANDKRSALEADAGAMENELFRLKKAVDKVLPIGAESRRVAALIIGVAPNDERLATRTERAILDFAQRVLNATFKVHGLEIGTLEIVAPLDWSDRRWPCWNNFWTDLRKALESGSIPMLRRRLLAEGRLRLTGEMRQILALLDGKRLKLKRLEEETGKNRKQLLRRDRRLRGPLRFLMDEGLVVVTRTGGYQRPDRPPPDAGSDAATGTERPP